MPHMFNDPQPHQGLVSCIFHVHTRAMIAMNSLHAYIMGNR
jgi:hypothetical protein